MELCRHFGDTCSDFTRLACVGLLCRIGGVMKIICLVTESGVTSSKEYYTICDIVDGIAVIMDDNEERHELTRDEYSVVENVL